MPGRLLPITIVLDIDETIANRYTYVPNIPSGIRWHSYPHNEKTVYCLFYPGLMEFIQFLVSLPDVKFVFFSNAGPLSNRLLVEGLLQQALGLKHPLLKAIKIFSCDSVVWNKKDLNLVIEDDENLDRVLMIENNPESFLMPQFRNAFFAPDRYSYEPISCTDTDDFLKSNHLFLLTAILKKALELDRKNFLTHINDFVLETSDKHIKWKYYAIGLAELQKFNANLNFFTDDKKLESFFFYETISVPRPQINMEKTVTYRSCCGLFKDKKPKIEMPLETKEIAIPLFLPTSEEQSSASLTM